MFIKDDVYKAKSNNCLSYGMNNWHRLSNWLPNIRQFFRNIKYASQRIKYGVSSYDTWNFDNYLATVMYFGLIHLAENTHGHPGSLENQDDWNIILKEMALHFANTQEWLGEANMTKKSDEIFEQLWKIKERQTDEEGNLVFNLRDEDWKNKIDKIEYNRLHDLWLKTTKDEMEFREDEKNKACDMFKEWFFALWD